MSKTKNLPLYRAKFCRVTGQDDQGRDTLSSACEIGAVWSRKDASKGAILKLDVVPQNFTDGVLFLDPVTPKDRGFA